MLLTLSKDKKLQRTRKIYMCFFPVCISVFEIALFYFSHQYTVGQLEIRYFNFSGSPGRSPGKSLDNKAIFFFWDPEDVPVDHSW